MKNIKHSTSATLIGGIAILLWSLLALFTIYTKGIPTFQLLTLTFMIASASGLLLLARKGLKSLSAFKQKPIVWITSVAGLFGYHYFYFLALNNAPAVQASLIAYLWPLLIVVFSALLPNERLRWFHILGASIGLIGAGIIISEGKGINLQTQYTSGYLAAITCAFIWSSYSVINRVFKDVPSDAVTGFCSATALIALSFHLSLETWVSPSSSQWLAIFGLGLGPVGLAFFVWDYGTKNGDIQILGTLAYSTPLLSTIWLILTGQAEPSGFILVACLLVVLGAVVASIDKLKEFIYNK